RAQDALAGVAALLGDAHRGVVVRADLQLDALEPELVERVARHELERPRRDAAAAGLGGERVADFALVRVAVEVDDAGDAEEGSPLGVEHRVAVACALAPALLVQIEPSPLEAFRPGLRNARVSRHERVLSKRLDTHEMLLPKRLEPDRVVCEHGAIQADAAG